jgi:hypothetical protein
MRLAKQKRVRAVKRWFKDNGLKDGFLSVKVKI